MVIFGNNIGYLIGIGIGLIIIFIYIVYNTTKKMRLEYKIQKATASFDAMATGKTYDEIVAIMKKPQDEFEKTSPTSGNQIKVATWKGGYYYWEGCMFDLVVVFTADGMYNNVTVCES